MGAYPEPALCADDASRLVPIGSDSLGTSEATKPRTATTAASRNGLKRCLLAGVVAGLALGSGLPAALAHDGTIGLVGSALQRADRPAEWGGASPKGAEPLMQAVAESDPGTAPGSKTDPNTLRFGDTSVPRPLAETIVRASEATGVDPVYMMALADKESSFDTDVKSPASSAQGLFQFVTSTWLEMIRDYGPRHGLAAEAAAVKGRGSAIGIPDEATRKRVLDLRNDPFVSGLMAGELIKRDRARIEGRIGRGLKTTELYIAHLLGTESAGKFLSLSAEAPEQSAQKVFGRAAQANRSIFTLKDGGKRRSLTIAEVHERLDGMIERRIGRYQAVTAMIAQETGMADEDRSDDRPVLDARLLLKEGIAPASQDVSVQ